MKRIEQVCEELNICRNTLRKWRQEGWVREIKIGRLVLIDLSPLEDSPFAEKLKIIDLQARARL